MILEATWKLLMDCYKKWFLSYRRLSCAEVTAHTPDLVCYNPVYSLLSINAAPGWMEGSQWRYSLCRYAVLRVSIVLQSQWTWCQIVTNQLLRLWRSPRTANHGHAEWLLDLSSPLQFLSASHPWIYWNVAASIIEYNKLFVVTLITPR